jgi:sialidase-1
MVGAVLPEGSDEVALVETGGGEIYVSYRRNTCRRDGRTFARSRDGGQTFYELGEHEELSGRPVHVGLARHGSAADDHPDVLLFSYPVGATHLIPGGADMTICVSRDGGRTWPISKLIDERPCRYSDLAVTADGTVLCIYTVGEIRDSEKLTVARFNQEWLFA